MGAYTRGMAVALTAITERVHMAQTPLVNWTVVADDAGVMLIDAGFPPGSRDEVLGSLRELGFGPTDVTAILLTHAHVDHFGTAIWFAQTHGTPPSTVTPTRSATPSATICSRRHRSI